MMLSDKLKLLQKKIEALDAMRPIDFLSESLAQIDNIQLDIDADEEKLIHSFSKQMDKIIANYQQKGLSSEILCVELYQILLYQLRKTMIVSTAKQLGIEPRLYKKQMDFLFKGKS